ncbi:MAG: Gfo/Idh/MocA family oxidoreductase [Proteobacteria bacterium]|nr:Gfo/Idh/MocA family oxidoreductase [Pseudomonadota bacterium]
MNVKPEIRIGLVGYGFIGKIHTMAYQLLPMMYDPFPATVRLVGVAAASQASMQKGIEQGGYEHGTTDWRQLVARDDIDVIDCCTPNFLHKEVLIAAMRAGKHVYCDKPLAMNLAEAREIAAVAEESGVLTQMTFNYRFVPAMMRAKQLVEEGRLGRVYSFRAAYLHAGYIDPNRPISWRLDASKGGGGALFDLGAHVLDLVRFLLGDFESINALTETFIRERPLPGKPDEMRPVEVDDLALMTLRMANGAVGTVEASRLATGASDELRLEIHGSDGALRFNLMDPNWLYVYDAREPGAPIGGERGFKAIETVQRYPPPAALPGPKFSVGWTRFHIASQYDFITSLLAGGPTSPDFEDGMKVQEVMEAGYLSSAEKRWISLPMDIVAA